MIPVYLLLLVVLLVLAYLMRKIRAASEKVFDIHNEVRELRKYDLRDLARELQAGSELARLLELDPPLPALGGWAASADFLMEIARHLIPLRPRTVVELGSGASTLAIARLLQRAGRGHLYSLDHDAAYASKTRRLLARHGVSDHATVIHAPLAVSSENASQSPTAWYDLDHLLDHLGTDRIDLLIIDGPPEIPDHLVRYPAGPALFPKLSDEGIAIVDDTLRETGQETVRRWAHEFPELSCRETRSGKGYAVFTRSTSGS